MYESVKQNGGFYIARYEAGNENGRVVSKKNATIWNKIGWSDNNDMTIISGGAVEKSQEFANQNGYTSVKSTLCYGVQWDATMNFIDSDYITNEVNGKPNCDSLSYVRNSTGRGNYSGIAITPSGLKLEYQVKNIYDLGGNVYEWTMESKDTNCRVIRGGRYINSGFSAPASQRYYSSSKTIDDVIGFRPTLYL